jgi:hypothetical protein
VNQFVAQTAVACRTPGTARIARTAPGVTDVSPEPAWISTSAPVACQEAVTSPLLMPWLTIPAKVARLSVSTSANAGSAPGRAGRGPGTKPSGSDQ